MIKVLRKSFNIIELVAEKQRKKERISLGEIAERFEMNQPTCSRIVKTLVDCGYLECRKKQRTYLLGAKAFAVVEGNNYHPNLTEITKEIVRECALKIGEFTLFAIGNRDRWNLLNHYYGNEEIRPVIPSHLENFYDISTGRVLLAYYSPSELNKYCAKLGIPHDNWPEANSLEKLKKELQQIKIQQYAIRKGKHLAQIAVPVIGDQFVGVIGCSASLIGFNKAREKYILKELKKASEKIISRVK